jgi:hypothetical protein
MAGKNPRDAVTHYLDPLSRIISCFTDSVLSVSGGYYPAAEPHALLMADGRAVRIEGSQYAARVIQHYRIVEEPGPRGPWRVSTAAYSYTLEEYGAQEIIAFHWHPHGRSAVTTPHMHLGASAKVGHEALAAAHVPTGRVALEDFVRLILHDFRVNSRRPDWQGVLDETQSDFNAWRSW